MKPKPATWKIEDLRAAEYNPRTISDYQRERLRESIDRFGLVEPVVVNVHPGREGVIVGGHQRTNEARALGWTEIDVVERDAKIMAARLKRIPVWIRRLFRVYGRAGDCGVDQRFL